MCFLSRLIGTSQKKTSTVSLGRLGGFYANELINEPFGRTYDIVDKKLKLMPTRTLEEVGASTEHCLKTAVPICSRGHRRYQ